VIDHVGIWVADREAARAFYSLALELLDGPQPSESDAYVEWEDFAIAEATTDRPPTRRLHIGFQATDRAQVDNWWKAMRNAGYADLGAPGPRLQYSPNYYGAFIADPAGNSIEAVHGTNPRRTDGTTIDHLWLRTQRLDDITRFYDAIAPSVGYQVTSRPGHIRIHKDGAASFSLVPGDPTENLHLAFNSPDLETLEAFHKAGTDAGFLSLGEPGERPQYHPGYYAAYLRDPDGHNIEAVHHQRP
jgi:catechol 2,3-dioxygenase-like lactoylglutathione lyase family enzyme